MEHVRGSRAVGVARAQCTTRMLALQAKRREAWLTSDEFGEYSQLSERFLAAVLEEQNASLRTGQTPRAAVRLARAVPVKLAWPGGEERSATFDLGLGGFSAVLASEPPGDAPLKATLTLARGERISATLRTTGVRRRRGCARVSFTFTELPDTDRMRLKLFIVTAMLPATAQAGHAGLARTVACAVTGAACDVVSL